MFNIAWACLRNVNKIKTKIHKRSEMHCRIFNRNLSMHISVASVSPCFQSGSFILVTLRIKMNGAKVTRLTAYDQTGMIAQSCTTSTIVADDTLELSITFDPANPICGIQQVPVPLNNLLGRFPV